MFERIPTGTFENAKNPFILMYYFPNVKKKKFLLYDLMQLQGSGEKQIQAVTVSMIEKPLELVPLLVSFF